MSRKTLTVVRTAPEEQRYRLRRMRAVEAVLLSEYDAAQMELDRVIQTHAPRLVEEAVGRYIQALQRMRGFLADGEIPSDVASKLAGSGDEINADLKG